MDLFACGKGTERQSTKLSALMALSLLVYVLHSSKSWDNTRGFNVNSPQSAWHYRAEGSSFTQTMPRLRGRPRRGARWYAAASRRKRHQRFVQAIRTVRRRRRATAAAALSPPGTLVEEEPWPNIPDDRDPPTRLGRSPSPHTPSILPQPSTDPNESIRSA
jgi:hypothetical protein